MSTPYYTRETDVNDSILPPISQPTSCGLYPATSTGWPPLPRDSLPSRRPPCCPLEPSAPAQAWDLPRRSVLDGPHGGLDDHFCCTGSRSGTPPHGSAADRGTMPSYMPVRPTSPGTQSRRQMMEIQDQLRMYKEELAKRDKLIGQLTSLETTPRVRFDTTKVEEVYTADRQSETAAVKTEVGMLQMRLESLQNELREARALLESREDKIRELTLEREQAKEVESRDRALVQSLRNKVDEYESTVGHIEGTAGRSEVAISTLQRENQEAQRRILELESRHRSHMEEKELLERQRSNVESQLKDLTTQLNNLGLDGFVGSSTSSDFVIESVRRVMSDNLQLKAQRETSKEQMEAVETELRAARETIMRLAGELEREKQGAARHVLDMESVRMERDKSLSRQREVEQEMEILKEKLEGGERSWSMSRRDMEEAQRRVATLEHQIRTLESQLNDAHRRGADMHRASTADVQHRAFKEALARLLTDDFNRIDANEEEIGQRVESLLRTLNDKKNRVELLEQQVVELTQRLGCDCDRPVSPSRGGAPAPSPFRGGLGRVGGGEGKRVEFELRSTQSLEESLRRAEDELAAGEILRDALRADKINFLTELSRKLEMDMIMADMGLDDASLAIMARVDQVMRRDLDSVQTYKKQIYSLQRKLKSMKEQLDSKELHMDLLRKKVASLEERLVGKTEGEREKDGEYVKNRKLIKLVEKYRCELNEAHVEIRDLKARLLQISEMQTRVLEKERHIEMLESKIAHLEEVRQKQADKLAGLEGEFHNSAQEMSKRKDIAANTIQALTSELRTTKQALDEIVKREHQLLDLRQVIARMLGLHIDSLAVPDYEIVARLEKLVIANQANAATAFALDSAIADMGEGFRAGYHDAAYALSGATRACPPPRRAMSPQRKMMDAKVY